MLYPGARTYPSHQPSVLDVKCNGCNLPCAGFFCIHAKKRLAAPLLYHIYTDFVKFSAKIQKFARKNRTSSEMRSFNQSSTSYAKQKIYSSSNPEDRKPARTLATRHEAVRGLRNAISTTQSSDPSPRNRTMRGSRASNRATYASSGTLERTSSPSISMTSFEKFSLCWAIGLALAILITL